jgi:DNA invertase Pin-like site-specific DNA recombinase
MTLSKVASKTKQRRAIGIVRVSEVGNREGESFTSPDTQRERIEAACERDRMKLLRVEDERDVSGGTPLAKRAGLRSAVEAVEAGEADVIVAAYFDRLVRSLRVQAELTERVEAAGGSVLALDTGKVSNGSAGEWLSSTLLGAFAEYQRRTTAERTGDAQRRALMRGAVPYRHIPPGYRRGEDGRLIVDEAEAKAVVRAFEMRVNGASIREIREHLARHGIARTAHGVETLLCSRVVLGELHFGELQNREAHPAIVERGVWERVQKLRKDPPPWSRSDRLLARLGILRCASCGTRMTIACQTFAGKRYPHYRCDSTDCRQRVSIAAEKVEDLIISEARCQLAKLGEAKASIKTERLQAQDQRDKAANAIDHFIAMLTPDQMNRHGKAKLDQLQAAFDKAEANLQKLTAADEIGISGKAAVEDRVTVDYN